MMTFRNLKTRARVRDSSKISEYLVFTLFYMLAIALPVQANNLVVENSTFADRNTTEHYGKIQFYISWDNSWRVSEAPANWDAAWVFAKWKLQIGTEWFHCTLSTADDEHTTPTGAQIDASFTKNNNGKGLFIYRNSDGKGSNDWNGVALRWNYGIAETAGGHRARAKELACNYLSVMDGMAYADWAGLRPMTELEFEKACRGPLNAVAGEYAGGKNSGVAGAGSRGGSWYTNATHLRISGRQKGGFAGPYRTNTTGFRCVRSVW